MTMKKYLIPSFALISIGFAPLSQATNGYQLTGIGSYEESLAGAVTANPGSAMTAISNPAGMARIGKRADFSLEMFMPDRFVDFTGQGGDKSYSAAKQYGVPALGWTAPVDDQKGDVYFGGGIYGTSGLGADYGVTQYSAAGGGNPAMFFEGYSAIQFWQMAPTLAWNVNKQLTIGGSLNIDYQSVSLKQKFTADVAVVDGIPDTTMMSLDLSRTAQAFGYGLSFGVLFDPTDKITLGFSYKSKQDFPDMEYQLGYGDIMDATGQSTNGCAGNYCPAGLYKLQLDFPAQMAVGVAYSPVKALTFSLDVKQIQWSDTLDVLTVTGPNGMRLDLPSGWDDQTVIAVGVEYAVNQRLNVRAGYNQADAPIDEADVDSNLILPAVVEKHYALGADWRLTKFWDLGFHYSKGSQNTLASSFTPTSIGLEIQTFGINLGYRF
jgi:long-chain fatty acid transport protein